MGHRTLSRERPLKAERCIAQMAGRGFEITAWFLAPDELSAFCEIVRVHDFQLYVAPFKEVMEVMEVVEVVEKVLQLSST
ncbi:hypothetical protein ABH945_004647 [Paraburkholderia sp. GAS333]